MIMKKEYSKPEVDVFESKVEGFLCASGEIENGASIEDVVLGDKYEW
jgi:hypothetical protein